MSAALLVAGEGLAAVLAAENAALAAGEMARAAGMLAAKTRALAAFEAARGAGATGGNEPAREVPHTAALMRRIMALARENRRLLERALTVQGRVLDVIARAASPVSGHGYRAAGRPVAPFRTPPVAIRASA